MRFQSLAMATAVAVALLGAGSTGGVARADNHAEKPYPISLSLVPGVRAFLTMETSTDVFNVSYHYGTVTPAANGAYQQNIGSSPSSWHIEDQRYGDIDVIGGVLHRNLTLLQTGLRMFDFGLDREAANGSFPGSAGLFHGTAMFLAQAGPAMIVLTSWDREPDLPSSIRTHISWEIGRMRSAATYLVDAWWSHPGHIDDGGKEERKFEAAIALESVGILANDSWLESKAAVYAREGVAMTRPNGVWTEHGVTSLCCYDSSYQALGLNYGVRYLALLGGGSLYQTVYKTVKLGERWEYSRTHANGTINRTGDDRTGPTCPERSGSGACKGADLESIFTALMRWGALTSNGSFVRRAYLVWLNNYVQVTHKPLPAPGLSTKPSDSMSIKQIENHQSFFVAGTRFQPVEPVQVFFGSTLVGTTVADETGNFGGHSPVPAVKFTPPSDVSPGTYTISARGAYGTRRSTTVSITR